MDAFESDEPYTRVFVYDEQEATPWSYFEEDYKVVAIGIWAPPLKDYDVFVLMSDEGDILFTGEAPVVEKIQGAGVFSGDAKRWGYMTALRQIGDRLYAVGGAGQIYRRVGPDQWEHMDNGVLQSPSVENRLLLTDINGANENDMYVCGDIPGAYGLEGKLYHWDGSTWTALPLPTTERLTRLHLQGDGKLWICGANGTLLHGNWLGGFVDVSTVDDNQLFYSLTEFKNCIYLASNVGMFMFDGTSISEISTALTPELDDTHVVQTVEGVLWSFGFKDIARFDGTTWTRLDHPDNPPIR